jgi:hypothetical protein
MGQATLPLIRVSRLGDKIVPDAALLTSPPATRHGVICQTDPFSFEHLSRRYGSVQQCHTAPPLTILEDEIQDVLQRIEVGLQSFGEAFGRA